MTLWLVCKIDDHAPGDRLDPGITQSTPVPINSVSACHVVESDNAADACRAIAHHLPPNTRLAIAEVAEYMTRADVEAIA